MRVKLAVGAAVGALALVGAGVGVAQAAIPDSSGVIHGCYKPQPDGHNSPLGVIDTALSNGHCPSGSTELTWNQTGPQGPTGATGATGPAGSPGVSNYQAVVASVPMGGGGSVTASCPTGDSVLGGGAVYNTSGNAPALVDDGPSGSNGWIATWVNIESQPAGSGTGTVTVFCAAVTS